MAAEEDVQDPDSFAQVSATFTEEKEFILDPYLFALNGNNLHQYCTMLSWLEQQKTKPEMFFETSQGISVPLSLSQVVEEFEVLPYSSQEDGTMQTKSLELPLQGSRMPLVQLRHNFMPELGEGLLQREPPSLSAASKIQQVAEAERAELIVSPEEHCTVSPEELKAHLDREGQREELNATILQEEDSPQHPTTFFIVTEQDTMMAPEGYQQSTIQEVERSDLIPGDNSRRGSYVSSHHMEEAIVHLGDGSCPSNNIGECFSEHLSHSVHEGSHVEVASCTCPACGKIFGLDRNLINDPLMQTPFKCPGCCQPIHFTIINLDKGQRIPADEWDRQLNHGENQKDGWVGKPFKCPDCGRGFVHKSSIRRHQKYHHKENASPVSEILKSCDLGLKHEMREKASPGQESFQYPNNGTVCLDSSAEKQTKPPDPCKSASNSLCREMSPQPSEFQKNKASTEKPFSCSECGKRFTSKCSVIRHLLLHQGVRPFKCPYCDKSYVQKGHMKRHAQAKHSWDSLWSETILE